MPFTTWIRDLFGIRKDVIDTKKSKLEVEKLEEEKRSRDLITPATLDDVKKYDDKYRRLATKAKHAARARDPKPCLPPPRHRPWQMYAWVMIFLVFLAIVLLLYFR